MKRTCRAHSPLPVCMRCARAHCFAPPPDISVLWILDNLMHWNHYVTSTITRLATGRNDWRGHDKINQPKPMGNTKHHKRKHKRSRKDFRKCTACEAGHKMTVTHVLCHCQNEHITRARAKALTELKKIFTSPSVRTRRGVGLDYFFNQSAWEPTNDTNREKPTREEIAKFLERVYRYVRKISPITGSLYSAYQRRKRRKLT